ncbi:hypothetical protein BGW80DRAFT_1282734 [Lactifluus volemus]|nr:hypothetical protein BGW80DRAFT_1282734 [Lactifluus volemus]
MQGTAQAQRDKYAILQRKLESLEKVHADGKKQNQDNLDALTKELSTVRKHNADQLLRIDKLKKQVDAQDTRIQDLKKTALADQTEIKDLRAKLRVAEAERVGAQKKYEEAMRTKQIVNSANVARRDELQERERRIVELETAIDAEKRRREDVETQLRDTITAKAEEEARRSSESAAARTELEQAQMEIAQARDELDADRRHSGAQREELVVQLKAMRDMLGQTATHYGKLVSETVSKNAYDELWRERNSLQFHSFRLERKLANTEAQTRDVNGLLEAELCATKEEKDALLATVEDLRKDIRSFGSGGDDSAHSLLVDTVYAAQKELLLSELEIQVALYSGDRLSVQSYAALNDELASSFAIIRAHLDAELAVSKTQAIELQTAKAVQEATTADLHSARAELESTRKQLEEASSSLSAVRASEAALIQEVKELRTQNKEQTTAHKQALQKEKETSAGSLAEEELRAEISQLTVDLTDAERYREAYHKLVDEVGILAARNQLAESEANRLSQFNAEILAHNNPAQRIVYLDRVRRELAETKQVHVVVVTRERDAAGAQVESLQRELSLYLSVPAEGKPRTTLTRVARTPLVPHRENVDPVAAPRVRSVGNADFAKHLPPLADVSGEMTLDEIT